MPGCIEKLETISGEDIGMAMRQGLGDEDMAACVCDGWNRYDGS
ncbi:MAG: hypothetical protein ACLTLQ_05735 [[Clostridium] scindens]